MNLPINARRADSLVPRDAAPRHQCPRCGSHQTRVLATPKEAAALQSIIECNTCAKVTPVYRSPTR